MTQAQRDYSHVTPRDLHTMNDDDFREVVNIDLKRNARDPGRRISPNVSDALRSKTHRERWLAMLARILLTVDAQLTSREADFFRHQAELGKQLTRAQAALEQSPDDRGAQQKLASLRGRVADLRAEYWNQRAKTTRFRSVVMDTVMEARALCGRAEPDAIVQHELDQQSQRAQLLEDSIRLHRDLVLADLDDGEVADEIDLDLWSLLPETR